MRLPPRHHRIIALLETEKRALTQAEIQQKLHMTSYRTTAQSLTDLTKRRFIKRTFTGNGNQYAYAFDHWPQDNPELVGDPPLSQEQVARLFKNVLRTNYPAQLGGVILKIQDILKEIIEFKESLEVGEQHSKQELKQLRLRLIDAKAAVINVAEGLDRLAATPELWDLETLASFLAVDEGLPSVTD